MTQLYYIAYGSNLHPFRLTQRVPSARLLGVIKIPGREVKFWKKSNDLSGKCDLVFADSSSIAYGALYSFHASEKARLDAAEGLGFGYLQATVTAPLDGTDHRAFTYIAARTHVDSSLAPYHWYKDMVVLGARYHDFPSDYVDRLAAVSSMPDMDGSRADVNHQILVKMKSY